MVRRYTRTPRARSRFWASATILTLLHVALGSSWAQEAPQSGLKLSADDSEVPEEGVDVPMSFRGPCPTVNVHVNGEGPFVFMIDTGGQGAARLDSTLVEKLGLEPRGTIQGGDPSGRPTRTLEVYDVEEIRIDGAIFQGLQAGSRDYNTYARGLPKIDGILGIHLFREHVLTLDYANRRVRIDEGPLQWPESVTPTRLVNEPDALPTIEILVGGKKQEAMIDSGMMGSILVPPSLIDEAVLLTEPKTVGQARSITGPFEIKEAQLETVFEMGDLRKENPLVRFAELFQVTVLGSELFAGHALTLDQSAGWLWLREPASPSAENEFDDVPLEVAFEDTAQIPIGLETGRPSFDVFIDGEGPFTFIFDTGAAVTVFDDDLTLELSLFQTGVSALTGPTGPSFQAKEYVVDELCAGTVRFSGFRVLEMDLAPMLGPRIRGILGWRMFAEGLLSIDYGLSVLRFNQEVLAVDSPGVLSYVHGESLPSFELTVADTQVRAHLDTGNPHGMTLPARLIESLPFLTPPTVIGNARVVSGSFQIQQGQIEGPLALGDVIFDDPVLKFQDRFETANVGGEVLKNLIVDIDYAHERIRFSRRQ